MEKQKKKELILILGLLLAAMVLLIVMRLNMGGTLVVVSVGGTEYGVYDLDLNTEIEIRSEDGVNFLEIKDGQASITSASCPDKICVHMHPLSEDTPGIIVCLPNEVIVELREK